MCFCKADKRIITVSVFECKCVLCFIGTLMSENKLLYETKVKNSNQQEGDQLAMSKHSQGFESGTMVPGTNGGQSGTQTKNLEISSLVP